MPRRHTIATLASLGAIGLAVHCFAQDHPDTVTTRHGDTTVTSTAPRRVSNEPVDRPKDVLALDERVTIDFKGGTVAEYIQAVRTAAAPKAVNILVPAEVGDVRLPAIKLQSVTLWAAWSALEPAIESGSPDFEVQLQALGGRSGTNVSSEAVQLWASRNPSSGTYRSPWMGEPAQPRPEQVDVISIADLVDPRPSGPALMKVEDVLAAVEAAAQVSTEAGHTAPTLKFHPASGVLISRGTVPANNLVKDVINTIRLNSAARAEQLDRAKLARSMYEQRLATAQAQLDAQMSSMETANNRFGNYKKLADSGSVSKMELDDARSAYENAARDAERAKQQLALVQSMGVESIMTELAVKGQTRDITDRIAQLEREVESLKAQLTAPRTTPGRTR